MKNFGGMQSGKSVNLKKAIEVILKTWEFEFGIAVVITHSVR